MRDAFFGDKDDLETSMLLKLTNANQNNTVVGAQNNINSWSFLFHTFRFSKKLLCPQYKPPFKRKPTSEGIAQGSLNKAHSSDEYL